MSKPNLEAKKERHRKLYEGQYHSFIGRIWYHFKRALRGTWHRLKPKKKLSHYMHPLDHMPAPKRLYTQVAIWSICLLLITSMNVTSAAYTGGEGVGAEYLALETTGTVISDDEGYILKPVPSGGEAVYDLNRIDNVIHEVQSGETLSVIA